MSALFKGGRAGHHAQMNAPELNADLQASIWRCYFTHHVLVNVPCCRLSPDVMQAFQKIKDRDLWNDHHVTTTAELVPAGDWVHPCLLQGGSWYYIGTIRDGLRYDIYVHGTSGALVYHEDRVIWEATIRVCDFNIYDIVSDGLSPERETFSLTLYEHQFCVWRLRHHLQHCIDEAHWLDNRKPEHILVWRPIKALWDELFVERWKREKQEEEALSGNASSSPWVVEWKREDELDTWRREEALS